MSDPDPRPDRPVEGSLHPIVYFVLLGLVAVLLLGVWGFAGDGPTDYLLVIVSGFIVMFVGLPTTLWLMVRREGEPGPGSGRFRDWAAGEFDTWQDRTQGWKAAVEVVLPIAAVAIGMAAFAIVLHLTSHSA